MNIRYEDLAKMIDHSLLSPLLTPGELENGCRLAAAFGTASVCIVPFGVSAAAAILRGSGVAVGTTVGFPHGVNTTGVKIAEAETALRDGATELDMVISIPLARAGRFDEVESEVTALSDLVHGEGAKLKVIFENCYLDDTARVALCGVCARAGADWVKTSTGYGSGGAVDGDLILMRRYSPPAMQVKAAGGIRTLDRLLEVRSLGCSRVGATRTAGILNEARRRMSMEAVVGFAEDSPSGY